MLTHLRITYQSRAKEAYDLLFWLEQAREKLWRYGYAIGQHLVVETSENRRAVSLSAYFTGRDAWSTASRLNKSDDLGFELDTVRRLASREPLVVAHKPPRPTPVPSCRCPKRTRPPLILRCCPSSKCPPLLCSRGGVIEFYKLPLSDGTLEALWAWYDAAAACARMAGWDIGVREGHYKKWAQKELQSKSSWIAQESNRLARQIVNETGRKVVTVRPPVSISYL